MFVIVTVPLVTNALIDCCVAICVELSEDISSSSRTAVPLTPVLRTALVNVLFVSVSVVALPTSVSVAAGSVTVTSAVDAGPISVTALVPLSVSSLKRIEPAAAEEPVSIGAVRDLFVSVCVPVKVATVESMLSVIVSVALATESNPVPPAIVSVFPFVIDCVEPESPAAEKDAIPEPVARTSVVPK